MDPKLAAQDLLSLSNLLRNIDPNTSNNFSTDAYNIQDSILHGLLGGNGSTNSGFPRIGFGALNPPSLNSGVEPFSPLSTSLNTSTPNIPLSVSIFIILIIIASIVGVILVRSRRFTLPRRISLLTRRLRPLNQDQPDKYRLNNAKDMIMYYFRKTTRIMGQRGVSKQHYETHREFSIKCVSRPESTPVGHVSGLYEKAMFSGREVTLQDAADAGNNVTIIETIPYNPAKNNSPL
jgi:hypothetical protein